MNLNPGVLAAAIAATAIALLIAAAITVHRFEVNQ